MSPERRGRPRSEATRVAILTAARDLVVDGGYDGVTIAGIAERAGSGVQTIYRWWPDKAAIVADCVLENIVAIDVITARDTGDAVGDLRVWIRESYHGLGSHPSAALFRALAVASAKNDSIAQRLDRQLGVPLRQSLEQLLARGVAAGQLRAGVDFEAAGDVLIGAMMMAIVTGRPPSPARADAVADLILGGLQGR